jgi:hypothetical protein
MTKLSIYRGLDRARTWACRLFWGGSLRQTRPEPQPRRRGVQAQPRQASEQGLKPLQRGQRRLDRHHDHDLVGWPRCGKGPRDRRRGPQPGPRQGCSAGCRDRDRQRDQWAPAHSPGPGRRDADRFGPYPRAGDVRGGGRTPKGGQPTRG